MPAVIWGYEFDRGKIYCINNLNLEQFYHQNKVDVIIDFSSAATIDTYQNAAKCGIRIVSAISKYEELQLAKLKTLSEQVAILYSPNITLGINFLIEASKVLQRIAPNADIEIIEEHFKGKGDVSGTAMRIAEDLGLDKEAHLNSIRVGAIVGKHQVVFGLPNQTIRIIHESLDRAAFGQGAIYAAKWIVTKHTGLFSMEQALALSMGDDACASAAVC